MDVTHDIDLLQAEQEKAELRRKQLMSAGLMAATIPASDAERIFVPFIRLSPNEYTLGVGLPLARCLATSMGYTLTLDTTYTQGARFVVRLK